MIDRIGGKMSSTVLAIIVPLITLVTAIVSVTLTNLFNRRTRKVEPKLIEAQADHETAETAASFIKTSQGLVDMLDRQLRESKQQHDEMQEKYRQLLASNDKLIAETRELRDQEESCVAKLAGVTAELQKLQGQVDILSEQVKSLGGEPQHLDVSVAITGASTVESTLESPHTA